MKIIALMPVKNEAWILPYTLESLSKICDHIIIADQNSDDGSFEIYKKFSKVEVITNNEKIHSNKVRWSLLDRAREYEGKNIILNVDADEFIPIEFNQYKEHIYEHT